MRTFVTAAVVAAITASGTATAASSSRTPAAPVEWVSVAKTDSQEAFVDPVSRREREGYVEAAVRYEYAQPQPYGRKTFQSARNVYRFDCAGGRLADRENRIYSEPELQGRKIGDATRSTKNLIWREAVPRSIDGAVLDYVCRKMAVGAEAFPASPPGTSTPAASGSGTPQARPASPPSRPATAPATGVPPPFRP